jgi:hypothetical protein
VGNLGRKIPQRRKLMPDRPERDYGPGEVPSYEEFLRTQYTPDEIYQDPAAYKQATEWADAVVESLKKGEPVTIEGPIAQQNLGLLLDVIFSTTSLLQLFSPGERMLRIMETMAAAGVPKEIALSIIREARGGTAPDEPV